MNTSNGQKIDDSVQSNMDFLETEKVQTDNKQIQKKIKTTDEAISTSQHPIIGVDIGPGWGI